MRRSSGLFLSVLFLLAFTPAGQAQQSTFDLLDGDRVVFIGDGLFENALDHGHLEYALTTSWPDRRVTFRNIGWSGDTPAGISRDHFTNPPTPYEHLIEQIKSTKPTVAFIGYGAHMAFEPTTALEQFNSEMAALMDTLDALQARVVLLTPAPQEAISSPAPTVAQHNTQLAQTAEAIKELAQARDYLVVDLFSDLLPYAEDPSIQIADNGFRLNDHGYKLAGKVLHDQLTGSSYDFMLEVDLHKATHSPAISNLQASKKEVSFVVQPAVLPALYPMPEGTQPIKISGLRRGHYTIWVDNKEVASVTAAELANPVLIDSPLAQQALDLQELIIKKNKTFFHQYRPQNETYLVGFREYEQGQNARELALLDPLIGQVENEIGRLRIPREVTIRVVAE